MSKKMTMSDLQKHIISEVKKLHRIEVLKEEKARINKELKMLNENDQALNELSPEVQFNAIAKAQNQGRTSQASNMEKLAKNNNQLNTFKGQKINFYFTDSSHISAYPPYNCVIDDINNKDVNTFEVQARGKNNHGQEKKFTVTYYKQGTFGTSKDETIIINSEGDYNVAIDRQGANLLLKMIKAFNPSTTINAQNGMGRIVGMHIEAPSQAQAN